MADNKNDWGTGDESLDMEQKGGVGELVKKVLAVGIGAAFLTEESIRNAVKEIKLPKATKIKIWNKIKKYIKK